jgi:serine/threonine-protein kinase HipA
LSRSLDVLLGDVLVGRLSEDGEGRTAFRISEEYRRLPRRPVLSQSFEDNLSKVYRGRRDELPAFFANLAPEGPLRELIEASVGIAPGDQMALLEAVGGDLPGAVELRPSAGEPDQSGENGGLVEEQPPPDASSENGLLRFSLAGVQLKFSVLREGDKLTLPVREKLGEWIVKLDSSRFPRVVENELATLEWARAAGFDVPECYLASVAALSPPLGSYANLEGHVLAIRRYDRKDGQRIHQEDFAQVVGLSPRLKYAHVTYEQLAKLVKAIAGTDAYFEFVRRLVFVVASGNADAHLKNWSLLYPDGVEAKLTPLYDQVCTAAWPEVSRDLALKFSGLKSLMQVDERSFRRLAEKAESDPTQTIAVVHDCLERIARAWHESVAPEIMPEDHVAALRDYWASAPLLRQHLLTG